MLQYADLTFYWITGLSLALEYVSDDGEGNHALVFDFFVLRTILSW